MTIDIFEYISSDDLEEMIIENTLKGMLILPYMYFYKKGIGYTVTLSTGGVFCYYELSSEPICGKIYYMIDDNIILYPDNNNTCHYSSY